MAATKLEWLSDLCGQDFGVGRREEALTARAPCVRDMDRRARTPVEAADLWAPQDGENSREQWAGEEERSGKAG
jgi:hypothetical protein